MEYKFEIGDIVEFIVERPDGNDNIHIGDTATVRTMDTIGEYDFGVEFDYDIDGHDCYGVCRDKCGYFVRSGWVRYVETDQSELCEGEDIELFIALNK